MMKKVKLMSSKAVMGQQLIVAYDNWQNIQNTVPKG
jgi:hypothetical protein